MTPTAQRRHLDNLARALRPSGVTALHDARCPDGLPPRDKIAWRVDKLSALIEAGHGTDEYRGELAGLHRVQGWLGIADAPAEPLSPYVPLEAQAARERRLLTKEPDALSAAAVKVAKLRRALWAAADKGPGSERRASGDCVCAVCGDAYRHHTQIDPSCPTLVGTCTGDRFKL